MLKRRMGLDLISHGMHCAKNDTIAHQDLAPTFFLYLGYSGQIAPPVQLPASAVHGAERNVTWDFIYNIKHKENTYTKNREIADIDFAIFYLYLCENRLLKKGGKNRAHDRRP